VRWLRRDNGACDPRSFRDRDRRRRRTNGRPIKRRDSSQQLRELSLRSTTSPTGSSVQYGIRASSRRAPCNATLPLELALHLFEPAILTQNLLAFARAARRVDPRACSATEAHRSDRSYRRAPSLTIAPQGEASLAASSKQDAPLSALSFATRRAPTTITPRPAARFGSRRSSRSHAATATSRSRSSGNVPDPPRNSLERPSRDLAVDDAEGLANAPVDRLTFRS